MSPITLNRFATRMSLAFRQLLAGMRMNTLEIILHYDAAVFGPGFDRNDQSTYPTPDPRTRTFNALVHFISDSTKGFGPEEFEIGDVLLFLLPTQDVSGENVWFVIEGSEYVQKESGTVLAEEWTVTINGQLIHRTMLLTRRRG